MHGYEKGIFLDPVKWESHSFPHFGDRGQAIVNNQILLESDLLIGIFWTKFGTDTGLYESGTQEEIEEFKKLNKPIMLYFSDAPISPNILNNNQYKKVKEYRRKYNGLYNFYKDIDDFKEKINNHLTLTIQEHFLRTIKPCTGLANTHSSSDDRITEDMVNDSDELLIFLKDGYTFFSKKYKWLTNRFQNKKLVTKIMIVHPEYEYIGAIAGMDPKKKFDPNAQKYDCINAIKRMQEIRKQIKSGSNEDISKRVIFIGYKAVPTWNGFITNNQAVIHLYPTMPYRGNLQTLEIIAKDKHGETDWYKCFRNEFEQIESEYSKTRGNNLWLYNYKTDLK